MRLTSYDLVIDSQELLSLYVIIRIYLGGYGLKHLWDLTLGSNTSIGILIKSQVYYKAL